MSTLLEDIVSPELIDHTTRSIGLGGIGAGTYSIINGLSTIGGTPIVPVNTDTQGLTFFTKPCLNLSYHNVIGVRELSFLADTNRESMANAIRCMLSPKGYDIEKPGGLPREHPYGDNYRSVITDDKNPFIPLLSNTLLSLSGWPDMAPEIFTSKESKSKSQVSWIDSRVNNFSTFDLTGNFSNIEGDPITPLFKTWVQYAARVSEGSMIPFPINIVENRVDYNTRIYRLILDRSGKFVQRIAATGAAFPMAVPVGAPINYNKDQVFSEESNQLSIPFKCMGALYDDPILIQEFNKVVVLTNPDMGDGERENEYTKITMEYRQLFDHKCYPRISETNELEWWVDTLLYNKIINLITENQQLQETVT